MRFVKTAENLFGLPTGFQRVEYLESSETQWIDTGFALTANSTLDFTFSPNEQSGLNFWVCGSYTTNTKLTGFRISSSTVLQGYIDNTSSIYVSGSNIGKKYHCVMNSTNWSVNGTDGASATQVAGRCNLTIFGWNASPNTSATNITGMCSAKLYNFKILDNGVPVRDFIPCIDPLGRACMYDLVEKKAYYNQGTGEFTVGRQIIPVEYLEIPWNSQGNRIKTNLTALENDRIIFDSEIIRTEATGDCYIARATNTYFDVGSRQNTFYIRFGSSSDSVGTPSIFGRHIYELYKEHFDVDGITKATPSWNSIGGDWIIGSTSSTQNVRHYSIKIKNTSTNETRADFVPCKDENNVGFMFDTVSGTVYENAGTGAFVVGQNKYNMKLRLIRDNILPTGYTQLEYIEATNANTDIQYAVGNYRLTDTTDWEITFTASGPSNNWVMGQPTWIGVHYRKDATTGNLPRVGIANSASSASQCYVDYTDDEKITLALKGTDVYANGVKAGSITRVSAGATQTKYGIFAYKDINQELPNLRIRNAKIYRLKIWDNDVLVQDLVPAINREGVAGFYERVNKTFIEKESNSTSDFTTGKPVLPIVRFPVDPVPVGYKTVNYLESTGTQYIDTGVYPTQLTEAEYKCAVTGSVYNADSHLFGSRLSASSEAFDLAYMNTAGNGVEKFRFIHGTTTTQETTTSVTASQLANPHTYYMSGTSFKVDGSEKMSFTTESFTGSYSLWLFGVNNAGSLHNQVRAQRVYYCKIWDNNTIVRNFIPVVRLLDNKAGMWDTVTKQFFGNAGTGDFITG